MARSSTSAIRLGVIGTLSLSLLAIIVLFESHVNEHSNGIIHVLRKTTAVEITLAHKTDKNSNYEAVLIPETTKTGLTFNGFLHFESKGYLFNYTLLNNRVYHTLQDRTGKLVLSKCVTQNELPSFHEITSSLYSATSVDASRYPTVQCAGELAEMSFLNERFVFCSVNGEITQVIGSDLASKVVYVPVKRTLVPPPSMDGKVLNCPSLHIPTPPLHLLRAKQVLNSLKEMVPTSWRRLEEVKEPISIEATKAVCRMTPRNCLFVHGAGVKVDTNGVTNEFSDYWGDDIASRAPCCKTIKYTRWNSVDNAWTSKVYQQRLCDAMVQVSNSKDKKVVDNLIVVTHSMGNLVLAGALANGLCSLGKEVRWVSLAGPYQGSLATDTLKSKCMDDSFPGKILATVLGWVGYCPIRDAYSALHSYKGSHSNENLDRMYIDAQRVYSKNVHAAACGRSPTGLITLYSAALQALSSIVNYSADNDGAVDVPSCTASINHPFKSDFNEKFYIAEINHADLSMRNGDGTFGDARKPLKWFENLF